MNPDQPRATVRPVQRTGLEWCGHQTTVPSGNILSGHVQWIHPSSGINPGIGTEIDSNTIEVHQVTSTVRLIFTPNLSFPTTGNVRVRVTWFLWNHDSAPTFDSFFEPGFTADTSGMNKPYNFTQSGWYTLLMDELVTYRVGTNLPAGAPPGYLPSSDIEYVTMTDNTKRRMHFSAPSDYSDRGNLYCVMRADNFGVSAAIETRFIYANCDV